MPAETPTYALAFFAECGCPHTVIAVEHMSPRNLAEAIAEPAEWAVRVEVHDHAWVMENFGNCTHQEKSHAD